MNKKASRDNGAEQVALLADVHRSLETLEALARARPDPRLHALVVRRRAAVLRLRRLAQHSRDVHPGARAELPRRDPDLDTVIAGEWRLAKQISGLIGRAPAHGATAKLLTGMRGEIEDGALLLRLMDQVSRDGRA